MHRLEGLVGSGIPVFCGSARVDERFATLCAQYLVDPDFCNVASGWEKGVVEKNAQDSWRRIWIEVADDKVLARHDRLSNRGETRHDRQHDIPLLQRKPGR